MLLVITLFTIHSPETSDTFVRTIRMGSWHTLARHLVPELIGTDLLHHQQDAAPPLFVCLDFWTTTEAYSRARRSPAVQSLLAARRQLADSCFELGAFTFATPPMFGQSPQSLIN